MTNRGGRGSCGILTDSSAKLHLEARWRAGSLAVKLARMSRRSGRATTARLHTSSSRSVERRYFCFGLVDGGVMTVRFTWRGDVIRIFGAGYWRKGRRIYEEQNR